LNVGFTESKDVDSLLIEKKVTDLWSNCLDILMSEIPEAAFYTWFTNLELIEITNNTVIIGTPNNFVLDYVSHHYKETIQTAARKVVQEDVSVDFVNLDKACNSDYTESPSFSAIPSYQEEVIPEKAKPEIDSHLPLNPAYTFDNFIVGDCNQLAHAASLAVAESPSRNNFNPLVLYGGTGLGKTHILQAIAHFCVDAHTAQKVVYRTSEEFTREYIEFVHKNKDSRSFYQVYKNTDVLLIDDIQFLAGKKSTQEEFFNIFNSLQHLNKQIVITSDRLPSEIKGLHSRLLSRFDTGLLANTQPPNLETRMAILQKKNEEDANVFINEEVLGYLATSVTSSVRELEGTLIKLSAFAKFNHMPMTVEIAKQILGDTIRNVNQPITIKKIIDQVAKEFSIPHGHLTSQSRKKNIAHPRQIAMYLARDLTDNSLHTIGLAFGRDYSTVIHSLKKIKLMLIEDPSLETRTQQIKRQIQENHLQEAI